MRRKGFMSGKSIFHKDKATCAKDQIYFLRKCGFSIRFEADDV
jgi:hypothetical protein